MGAKNGIGTENRGAGTVKADSEIAYKLDLIKAEYREELGKVEVR